MERFAQFTPPPPEAIREAERRMLAIFQHGQERKGEEG